MAMIFLSFVVVTGMGGMVSLAQATFVTAGGFAAGWALTWDLGLDIPLHRVRDGQINFLWAALFGAIVGAALGALIALLATRLGGVMLALGHARAPPSCARASSSRSSPCGTAATSVGRSGHPRSTSPGSTGW